MPVAPCPFGTWLGTGQRRSSATTASENGGHACFAHSPKSRSVSDAERRAELGVDPQERARAAEVAERARRDGVAHPVARLRVAQLEAEAPVVRRHPAVVGQHAVEPRERDRRRLGERLRRDHASARAARARAAAGRRAGPTSRRPAPRAARSPPCRAARAPPRAGTRRTASRRRRPRAPRAPRSPRSSRCAAHRAGAIAAPPDSNGSPEACASRCRTVEPAGPAGSSRSTTPSSAATSTASAVASFVTEAQRKTRSASPCVATTPSARTTPAAACGAGHSSIRRKRLHGARCYAHGAPPHQLGHALGAHDRLLARRAGGRPRPRQRHRAGHGRRLRPAGRPVRPGPPLPGDHRRGARRGGRVRRRRRAHAHLRHRRRVHRAVGRAHGEVFGEIRPATTGVVVQLLDPRWLVEIEAEAIVTE